MSLEDSGGLSMAGSVSPMSLWLQGSLLCLGPMVWGVAGCADLQYSRISGEAYYSWLSSYGPVIQFGDVRTEGYGVACHVPGPKAQLYGFVTQDDRISVAQEQPERRMQAMAFQTGFSEGTARGIVDRVSGTAIEQPWHRSKVPDSRAPSEFKDNEGDWWRGWNDGYANGLSLSRTEPINVSKK